MGKGLFSVFGVVLFVFTVNAQEKIDSIQEFEFKCGSIITSYNKEVIEYKFKSLDDLNEQIEAIIKEFDFNSGKNKDVCEIVIELKLEIEKGVSTILLSETIKTTCGTETIEVAIKKLKAMVIAASIG